MEKEGAGSRKERARETREKIYACAEQLFTERGVDDVSVDAIVEAAGVAKGSFYVHFESKDALIAMLIADRAKKTDLDYAAFLEILPADMPAPDILMALAGKIADVISGTFGHDKMTVVYKVQLTGASEAEANSGYHRAVYGMFRDIIERGVRRGELKTALPVDVLARHLVMAFRGLTYEWCIRYPALDLKAETLTHFGILLNGIRAV
jgi:AcrR family transcriptional regulator